MVQVAGLGPAREIPTDFKSVASTCFAIPAGMCYILAYGWKKVKQAGRKNGNNRREGERNVL